MRNRNPLEITITIDKLVHDKVIKYLKKKGITHAVAFDEFTNKVLEQKINYIKNQNFKRKQRRKRKSRKRKREEKQINHQRRVGENRSSSYGDKMTKQQNKSHSKECTKLNDHSFKEVCICSDSNSDESERSEQKERPEWSWLNE